MKSIRTWRVTEYLLNADTLINFYNPSTPTTDDIPSTTVNSAIIGPYGADKTAREKVSMKLSQGLRPAGVQA